MSNRRVVQISPQVMTFVMAQAPEMRRRLRLALRGLAKGSGDGKALEGALSGYHRLRVGSARIIFRYGGLVGDNMMVYGLFAEQRSLVYLLLEDALSRGLVEPGSSRL